MIGVFDSGHGGLTILRALVDRLPDQSFVYLGDHANAPYGMRAPDDILNLTRTAVEHLFSAGCRVVVLACNTASAVALRRLQQEWLPHAAPDRRILGVIVPTVEAVTNVPWSRTEPWPEARPPRTVAVFATPRTVESGAFVREIACRAPEITVVQQACPELAGRIEAGASREKLRALISGYVAALIEKNGGRGPDSVLLGCTHYPIIAHKFAQALPAGTPILSQPDLVATSLIDYLLRHPRLKNGLCEHRPPRLFTTGHAELTSAVATRFFGEAVTFEPIEHLISASLADTAAAS